MMDVSFVLVEGEEERPTDQVIATMANLIRADAFQLEFGSFRAKFLTLQAGQLITTLFSPQLKRGGLGWGLKGVRVITTPFKSIAESNVFRVIKIIKKKVNEKYRKKGQFCENGKEIEIKEIGSSSRFLFQHFFCSKCAIKKGWDKG